MSGNTRLSLRFWREGERTRWDVLEEWGGPEVKVLEQVAVRPHVQ